MTSVAIVCTLTLHGPANKVAIVCTLTLHGPANEVAMARNLKTFNITGQLFIYVQKTLFRSCARSQLMHTVKVVIGYLGGDATPGSTLKHNPMEKTSNLNNDHQSLHAIHSNILQKHCSIWCVPTSLHSSHAHNPPSNLTVCLFRSMVWILAKNNHFHLPKEGKESKVELTHTCKHIPHACMHTPHTSSMEHRVVQVNTSFAAI